MLEELVKKHGEKYRRLIIGALSFYEANVKRMEKLISREEFVASIVKQRIKGTNDNT